MVKKLFSSVILVTALLLVVYARHYLTVWIG